DASIPLLAVAAMPKTGAGPPESVNVTVPPALPLAPRAFTKPDPEIRNVAASIVSMFEPTTSVPVSVTLRAPKSRPHVVAPGGGVSVTVPSRVQLLPEQQSGLAMIVLALQVPTVQTATAARPEPSTLAAARNAIARPRVSDMGRPPGSRRRG